MPVTGIPFRNWINRSRELVSAAKTLGRNKDVRGEVERKHDRFAHAFNLDTDIVTVSSKAGSIARQDAGRSQLNEKLRINLSRLSESPNARSNLLIGFNQQIGQAGHSALERTSHGDTQLIKPWDRIAIRRFGRVIEDLEELALDALAHHVFPAACLFVHELPFEPDDVSEQTLGKTVLAHDMDRLRATLWRELKASIVGHDHETVTFHPANSLGDRRA